MITTTNQSVKPAQNLSDNHEILSRKIDETLSRQLSDLTVRQMNHGRLLAALLFDWINEPAFCKEVMTNWMQVFCNGSQTHQHLFSIHRLFNSMVHGCSAH